MTNQVQVTVNPTTNQTVNTTSNPDVNFIRVEQKLVSFKNGFAAQEVRSALIFGTPDVCKALASQKVLQGKIVVTETTTGRDGQTPKINPQSGEILTHNGMPIYRNTTFTQDETMTDTFLSHVTSDVAVQTPVGATNGEN